MCSLLLILAAFLTVRAIDEQEQSGPQTSILRTTRNGDCPNMFRRRYSNLEYASMVQASYIDVVCLAILI